MKNFLLLLVCVAFATYGFSSPDSAPLERKINITDLNKLHVEAESYYYKNNPKALSTAKLLADQSLEAEQMDKFAFANELMGRIYLFQGEIKEAEKCFVSSFDYWESVRDTSRMSYLYSYFGELNFVQCNYSTADGFYKKSLELKKTIRDTLSYAYSYNALGNVQFETCHYTEALTFYLKALNLNRKYNNISGICYSLNALGTTYKEINNTDLAIEYFNKALKLGEENQLIKNIAYSLNQLASLQNNLGNRNTSIELYTKSLNLSYELGSKNGIASSYMGMGEVFQSMAQNDKAIEFQHKALKLFEELDSKKKIAKCYENLGLISYSMRDYKLAIEKFEQAIALNNQISYVKGSANVLRKLGNAHLHEGRLDLALFNYEKSLQIQKSIDNLKGIASCYTNIGLIYVKQNNFEKAEEYFNLSVDINKNTGNLGGLGSVYNNLAALYDVKNDSKKAIHYLKNSLNLATKINRKTLMAENYRNLSDIYLKKENYKLSLQYYKDYVSIYNQLYNAQAENRIGWIQMQNEKEKRENLVRLHAKEQFLKEEKLQKERLTNTFLILIVGLIILFSGIVYRFFLVVKKSNKNLNNEIEERKKAEALLADHQRNLESLVKIRTLELLKAKEKAEQADRLKTSFLANMSHEIRTPMNAIIGFSKLMAFTNSKEKHEYYTNIINDNGHILLTLVNDIIDISMIESKQLKIKKSNFYIYPVLEELRQVFEEQKHKAEKSDLEINLYIPEEIENISMHSDQIRLKQILINLLRNAMKFTDSGKIDFGIELIEGHIRFFVKDTGIGIPYKDQALIYDRFRQASNNGVQHGGTGLGLTISKSLAELLNGKIWFTSDPDKGSEFYVEFLIDDDTIVQTKSVRKENNPLDFSGKNILVAEDVESNFLYINEVLKKVNANVTWSQDGVEAVEKFQDDHFDLVLMDIQLPRINGYQATREIKKQNPSVPVVAQSAYAFRDESNKMTEAGCDAFIAKPYTEEELLAIIQKNMHQKN
ncbi:tetratricopeptide repeat-containing hybrid sensor histidine kinase/response regulator [Marinifilum caeruleilacunae]|nr:tetratricopeptide repeat protein [Marinifilum caeruleilacunae]